MPKQAFTNRTKHLIRLGGITLFLALLSAGVYYLQQRNAQRTPENFHELDQTPVDMALLTGIVLKTSNKGTVESLHLNKADDGLWYVQEADYPADFYRVQQIVQNYLEANIIAEKSDDPTLYPYFGVADVAQWALLPVEDTLQSIEVTLLTEAGTATSYITGKHPQTYPHAVYARRKGDAAVYIINHPQFFQINPYLFMDPIIFNLLTPLTKLHFRFPSEPTYTYTLVSTEPEPAPFNMASHSYYILLNSDEPAADYAQAERLFPAPVPLPYLFDETAADRIYHESEIPNSALTERYQLSLETTELLLEMQVYDLSMDYAPNEEVRIIWRFHAEPKEPSNPVHIQAAYALNKRFDAHYYLVSDTKNSALIEQTAVQLKLITEDYLRYLSEERGLSDAQIEQMRQ